MARGHLMKQQKKDVFDIIGDSLLCPEDFEWDDPGKGEAWKDTLDALAQEHELGPSVDQLNYRPSGGKYFFRFKHIEDDTPRRFSEARNHAVEFRPTADGDVTKALRTLDWDSVCRIFIRWLTVIQEEERTPDVWGQLRATRDQIEKWDSQDRASEPFTPEEKAYLEDALDEFEKRVEEKFELHQEEIDMLREHVGDLREQLDTAKRRQWTSTALGVILKVGLHVGFSNFDFAEAIRHFDDFLSGLPLLPPGN